MKKLPDDISRCSNDSCAKRFTCLRYLDRDTGLSSLIGPDEDCGLQKYPSYLNWDDIPKSSAPDDDHPIKCVRCDNCTFEPSHMEEKRKGYFLCFHCAEEANISAADQQTLLYAARYVSDYYKHPGELIKALSEHWYSLSASIRHDIQLIAQTSSFEEEWNAFFENIKQIKY